jgi:hypothetical protein
MNKSDIDIAATEKFQSCHCFHDCTKDPISGLGAANAVCNPSPMPDMSMSGTMLGLPCAQTNGNVQAASLPTRSLHWLMSSSSLNMIAERQARELIMSSRPFGHVVILSCHAADSVEGKTLELLA